MPKQPFGTPRNPPPSTQKETTWFILGYRKDALGVDHFTFLDSKTIPNGSMNHHTIPIIEDGISLYDYVIVATQETVAKKGWLKDKYLPKKEG